MEGYYFEVLYSKLKSIIKKQKQKQRKQQLLTKLENEKKEKSC